MGYPSQGSPDQVHCWLPQKTAARGRPANSQCLPRRRGGGLPTCPGAGLLTPGLARGAQAESRLDKWMAMGTKRSLAAASWQDTSLMETRNATCTVLLSQRTALKQKGTQCCSLSGTCRDLRFSSPHSICSDLQPLHLSVSTC